MDEIKSSEGINKLTEVLQGRMHTVGEKPPTLDIGVIQGDMSLLTNKFPIPIPQTDYLVCRSVQWGGVGDIFYRTQASAKQNSGEHMHGANGEHEGHTSGDGTHEHPAGEEMKHVHDTLIGEKFRWLRPGDRVLVAWVGDDACVIDLVYPATRIGRSADSYEGG